MPAMPLLILALLVAIFLLRKRVDPRGKKRHWQLVQLMIVLWIVFELRLLCR